MNPTVPYPLIMGQPISREEIIEALWDNYHSLVRYEREKDSGFVGWPDCKTILDYIEEHGLPPKS